ncbi:MxaS protein [Ramlibacter sp. USB13]|uniref:MxaS protein n=1 Tax=Ramlibacter cellulosilyticus TaxID=2764187 RepID=A0A923MMS8_9BURK|nr:VWA domain-containing protein [Ramlibacter cellulosilyticus]MBC5782210.1 MxaS protein [Ramlibacter cellulosilyticus]
MAAVQEFRYRSPHRVGGWRTGTHEGTGPGAGLAFATHLRLFDWPDPRRLDLRASMASLRSEWLVRVNRQQAAMTVRLLVDVSASMRFGTPSKLEVVADFARALGQSAFRVGDAVGMAAFDRTERPELRIAAWRHRGMGEMLASLLLQSRGGAGGIEGLREAAMLLQGRGGIVFLASDFQWPLEGLHAVLDLLAPAHVVPLVVWDAAELEPPAADGLATVRDAESGRTRTLWLRPALRTRWREAFRERRMALDRLFGLRGVRPFHLRGAFDAQALTNHLCEVQA